MNEYELIKNGFFFTTRFMWLAFTNGTLYVLITRRKGNHFLEAVLCDSSGTVLDDNVRSIEDVLKNILKQ